MSMSQLVEKLGRYKGNLHDSISAKGKNKVCDTLCHLQNGNRRARTKVLRELLSRLCSAKAKHFSNIEKENSRITQEESIFSYSFLVA